MGKLSLGLVRLAVLGRTGGQRAEVLVGDRLEDFAAAAVTGVGIDLDDGLDIGHSRGNSAHRDEVAQVVAPNLAHGQRLGRVVDGA